MNIHCDGTIHKAKTYYANTQFIDRSLKPFNWYLKHIINGAEEYCLYLSYIDNILKKTETIIDSDKNREQKETLTGYKHNNDSIDMGGFNISQWKSIREKIKDINNFNSEWEEAIIFFNSRINRRYFEPIYNIKNIFNGSGFTITTLLCILIEHLAAFREGKIHNISKRGETPTYEYRYSDQFYINFLKTEEIFKGYFFTEDGTPPLFCVDDFYKNVRCALVHEACIKNNWRINITSCYPNPKKLMFLKTENVKRIFRDILLEKLCEYVNNYMIELEDNHDLRLNFARKMDSLCEILPDEEYSWWREI